MAASRMSYKSVGNKEPFLRNMVADIRFEEGFVYLDRAGTILKKLVRDYPFLTWSKADPTGTQLVDIDNGAVLNFSSGNVTYSVDRTNTTNAISEEEQDKFAFYTVEFSSIILSELEITQIYRVGFRQQHYFNFETKLEADNWVSESKIFSLNDKLSESFSGAIESSSLAVIIRGDDCRYRIAVNAIERNIQIEHSGLEIAFRESSATTSQRKRYIEAQKNKRIKELMSRYGAVIDIDSYLQDPDFVDLEDFLQKFVKDHLNGDLNKIRSIINRN